MGEAGIRWDIARFKERVIFGVRGPLDVATAPDFERDVLAALTQPVRGVVIDLAYCTFVDDAGIRALLRVRDRAEELSVAFQLTSIPRAIEIMLRVSGLTEAFG